MSGGCFIHRHIRSLTTILTPRPLVTHALLHETKPQDIRLVNLLSRHTTRKRGKGREEKKGRGHRTEACDRGRQSAMDSARSNAPNDHDDALEQIFQIDRQLRTGKAETQLGTLQSLPLIFQRLSSSPVAIDTIYLRLVDFFCSASNEMRLAVTQTMRVCRSYAERIDNNAEEMQRRLGVVWSSNDVLGRVLILKVIAYTAPAMAKLAEAVYRVAQSMRAEHEEEHEAAAFAALEIVKCEPRQVNHFVDVAVVLLGRSHRYSTLRTTLLSLLAVPSFDGAMEQSVYDQLDRITHEQEGEEDDRIVALMTTICLRYEAVLERQLSLLSRLSPRGGDQLQLVKKAYLLS